MELFTDWAEGRSLCHLQEVTEQVGRLGTLGKEVKLLRQWRPDDPLEVVVSSVRIILTLTPPVTAVQLPPRRARREGVVAKPMSRWLRYPPSSSRVVRLQPDDVVAEALMGSREFAIPREFGLKYEPDYGCPACGSLGLTYHFYGGPPVGHFDLQRVEGLLPACERQCATCWFSG